MSTKEIDQLIAVAENRKNNPVSKEDALKTLINAGILNKNGDFSSNYPYLAAYNTSKKL